MITIELNVPISIDSLPDALYEYIGSSSNRNGSLCIVLKQDANVVTVQRFLSVLGGDYQLKTGRTFNVTKTNDDTYVVNDLNQPVAVRPQEPVATAPMRVQPQGFTMDEAPPNETIARPELAVGGANDLQELPDNERVTYDGDDGDDDDDDDNGNGTVNRPSPDYSVITSDRVPVVIASQMQNDTTSIGKQLEDSISEYESLNTRLIEMQRKVNSLSRNLTSDNVVSKIQDQMTSLRGHAKVASVDIDSSNCIAIKTIDLVTSTPYRDHVRHIGVLSIHIPLNIIARDSNLTGSLKIRNHTHRIGAFEAPHIRHGSLCLGNGATAVRDALINCELSTVVDVIISLVTAPNQDDEWGESVFNFPRV